MIYLLMVSVVWAFSFPLIGHWLRNIDPTFLAALRLLISLLVFLPFCRLRRLPATLIGQLVIIGALQYGMMYVAYLEAFQYLAAHEVALFTILTPLYTTLINDLAERRFHPLFLATAGLAVAGTAIVKQNEWTRLGFGTGFLLVQASNVCFAYGQIHYRRLMARHPGVSNTQVYALLYAGAFLLPALVLLARGQSLSLGSITAEQWQIILYLGAVASGLCFFLWNISARRVNAGALAILNNMKIPLAVALSIAFFGERTDPMRLALGGGLLLLALLINEWLQRKTGTLVP